MRYLIFIILLLAGRNLSGKKVPKYIKEHFTNCYTGKPTQLRQFLNIDGYYEEVWLGNWSSGYGEHKDEGVSFKLYVLLYEDGSFVYNFKTYLPREYGKFARMEMCGYLQTAYKDPIKYRFYNQRKWGIYRLDHDTLVMQYIHPRGSMNDDPWFAFETRYKIIDRNTIERIKGTDRYLSKVSEKEQMETRQGSFTDRVLPAKFVPCSPIPPPDCWLKQEDWLWCKDKIE